MTLHAVVNILTEFNQIIFLIDFVGSQVLLILIKAYQQRQTYVISRVTTIMKYAQNQKSMLMKRGILLSQGGQRLFEQC